MTYQVTRRQPAARYRPSMESRLTMNNKRGSRSAIGIGVAAGLFAFQSMAVAAPTSEWRDVGAFQAAVSTSGLSTGPFQSTTGLGTTFDSSSFDGSGTSAVASDSALAAQTAEVAAASPASTDQRRRALASPAETSNTSPVVGSAASLQLTLWNFVSNIRAQQAGDQFVQLQTASANIDYTLNGVPAPVPVPPAFWLFGCGLAGLLTGYRRLRRKGSGIDSRALAPT